MATCLELGNSPAPNAGVDSGPRNQDERHPITADGEVHTRSDPSAGRFSSAHQLRVSAHSTTAARGLDRLEASAMQVRRSHLRRLPRSYITSVTAAGSSRPRAI